MTMKDRKRIRDSQETEETAHVLSSSSTTSKEEADDRKSWEKVDEKMILFLKWFWYRDLPLIHVYCMDDVDAKQTEKDKDSTREY